MGYSDFILLGGLSMIILSVLRRKRYNMSIITAFLYAMTVFILGMFGVKLLYLIESYKEAFQSPELFLSPEELKSGFSFFGCVLISPPLILPIKKLFKLRSNQAINAGIPLGALMLAIMRLGCYSAGCCGGIQGYFLGRNIIWPTQLMECAGDVLIFAIIILCEQEEKYQYRLYELFLTMYGILRFLIEFLRDTPKDWLGMSHGQVFALISIIIGSILLLSKRKKLDTRA